MTPGATLKSRFENDEWFANRPAQEVADPGCFTKNYWKSDPAVRGSKNLYMRMVPDVAHTFRRTIVRTGRKA